MVELVGFGILRTASMLEILRLLILLNIASKDWSKQKHFVIKSQSTFFKEKN